METTSKLPEGETHIGDGVYISFDGCEIILRTPRERRYGNGAGDHWVALEPAVFKSMLAWIRHYPIIARGMGV